MELRNETPLPALDFDSIDTRGQAFHVVVVRATFEISENGVLRPAEEQRPLVMADELYGALGSSSIKEESDLAPFKPKCDVVVIGDAVAPHGTATGRFEAGITIRRNGDVLLNKRITVTGARFWEKRLLPFGGWKLTEPSPIRSLPIRYEYAYGGDCRISFDDPDAKRLSQKNHLAPEQRTAHPDGLDRAPVAHACFGDNTVGRGYAEKWYLSTKRLRRIPAPQIESISDPIKTFGKPYAPQGLGFLAKSSTSRIALAGTMDETFIQSGKSLPEDFDFGYWNGAPADMQIPWLQGNEEITLTNIGEIERLVLPDIKLCVEVNYVDGQMAGLDFKADTVIINAEQMTVSLVYRLKLALAPVIESLEIQQLSAKERDILMDHVQSVNRKVLGYQKASR